MAEIVNLRRARKAKARDAKEQQAADNRLRFGRTRNEKAALKQERERLERVAQAHLLTPPEDTDG